MKTRDRILSTALLLFNDEGEANVTTVDIADEMDISPGNLYYHFKGKDQLVSELFDEFQSQFIKILQEPTEKSLTVADSWFYVYVVFNHIYQYRFLYRNLTNIFQRYNQIQRPFRRLLELKIKTARSIIQSLQEQEMLIIDEQKTELLANSIAVTITYWLNFDNLLHDKPTADDSIIHKGVLQVLSLIAPYLGEQQQAFVDACSEQYRLAIEQATQSK
jgi:AcrR family transcriptional regulator